MKLTFKKNDKTDLTLVITNKWEDTEIKALECKVFGNVYAINLEDNPTKIEFYL
jgi:hypothetical protein